jgi:hypothetical protein
MYKVVFYQSNSYETLHEMETSYPPPFVEGQEVWLTDGKVKYTIRSVAHYPQQTPYEIYVGLS